MRIHLFHDENEYGRAGRDDDDGDDEAHEEEVGRVPAVGRVVPRRAATVVKYKKGKSSLVCTLFHENVIILGNISRFYCMRLKLATLCEND